AASCAAAIAPVARPNPRLLTAEGREPLAVQSHRRFPGPTTQVSSTRAPMIGRAIVGSLSLPLSQELDRFFEPSSGTECAFNEHVIGKFNLERLFHVQQDSDRSH